MTVREQRMKVMAIGNRLSVSMNRHDAFVTAWQVIHAGGVTLPVKGTSFGNRPEALRRLASYEPSQIKTFLCPEENNSADSNAIAVMVGVQGGRGLYRLGYIPVHSTAVVRALSCRSLNLKVVSGCWNYRGREWETFGARVTLGIY